MFSRAVAVGESAREFWRWYRVVVLQGKTLSLTSPFHSAACNRLPPGLHGHAVRGLVIHLPSGSGAASLIRHFYAAHTQGDTLQVMILHTRGSMSG